MGYANHKSKILITPCNPKDHTKELFEIEQRCFPRGFRWNKKVWPHVIKYYNFLIAKINTKIVAFLAYCKRKHSLYIASINVLENFRGRGIASKLISAVQREAESERFKSLSLEVNTQNPAQTLYFKLGFRTTTIKRNYYKRGADALRMIKVL